MTDATNETARFEDGESVEIEVNGNVVGRVEERPESSVTIADDAALALEIGQLVESMNELLRDHHEAQPKDGESISAEIVASRDDSVETIENPPNVTGFEDVKYIEIRRDGESIARVEHMPTSTLTDSELAGLSLTLEGMVDGIEEELEESYGRTPYNVLKETGSTLEINAAGTDGWITRVE